MVLAEQVLRLAAAAPNVHFSFLSIPTSNAAIFPSHSNQYLPTNLKVYDIAAPSGKNLEEEGEWYYTTAPQSYEMVIEAAEAEIGVPVSCLLTDVITASASEIATKMGVKWIAVWVAAPYGLLAQVHTHAIIDHLRVHSQEGGFEFDTKSQVKNKMKIDFVPGLSVMRVEDLPNFLFERGTGNTSSVVRVLGEVGSVLPKASAVVLNCFEEENLTEAASVLRSKVKTLLQIGCPVTQPQRLNSDQNVCLSWLDQQRPKSVVYISFGTMLLLPPEEISAIAEALEKKETPYLWSLKDRIHLPPGFLERTMSYGKIVEWAPQTLVLSHPSIGAHLMHAGFNSMMESVIAEVPLILRPIWADNMMNARMAEEAWQIGVVVEGRVITQNGLIECLEMVLGDGEEGKKMRDKIKVLKTIMVDARASNGTATKDFNSLVELISK